MLPVISIVGPSGSGKTTLLNKLVAGLKRLGLHVTVIKHCTHDYELDCEGKDSWQFARAGADTVVVSTPGQWAMFKKTQLEWDLEALQNILPETDIVLTEGFRKQAAPKIEIIPPGGQILSSSAELVALISEDKFEVNLPCFARDETEKIVAFLADKFQIK